MTVSSEKAYNFIKRAIIYRKIAPGTKLIEQDIANKLGIGRTPVRAAFKILENEKLVEIVKNKGCSVINPSYDDINALFKYRADIEVLSVDYGFDNISEKTLNELVECIEKEQEFYMANDIEKYIEMTYKFHSVFAKNSGNTHLNDTLERLLKLSISYLALYDSLYTGGEYERSDDHLKIVEFIRENKKEELKEFLHKHVLKAMEQLHCNLVTTGNIAFID